MTAVALCCCCAALPAGALVRGLGPQLLADLSGLPVVRAGFPRLHAEMQAALQHCAATQLHTGACRAHGWLVHGGSSTAPRVWGSCTERLV